MSSQDVDVYCFDTGAFIKAWHELYPIEVFPTLWDRFEEMISTKSLISVDAVFEEIGKKEDDLQKWVKERKSIFIQHDIKVQKAVKEILMIVPDLYEVQTDRSGADPYVVAAAKINNAVVVSNENKRARGINVRRDKEIFGVWYQ